MKQGKEEEKALQTNNKVYIHEYRLNDNYKHILVGLFKNLILRYSVSS